MDLIVSEETIEDRETEMTDLGIEDGMIEMIAPDMMDIGID